MTVKELADKLNLEVVAGAKGLNNAINGAYVSDLLSDVMGYAKAGDVWITLQTHKNVMAVASLRDLPAVILVKGFKPEQDMAEQAENENIPVLISKENTFDIAGKIYSLIK
jgi:serine kinase of HPr protein (carbohydrate metabolism regulator)